MNDRRSKRSHCLKTEIRHLGTQLFTMFEERQHQSRFIANNELLSVMEGTRVLEIKIKKNFDLFNPFDWSETIL